MDVLILTLFIRISIIISPFRGFPSRNQMNLNYTSLHGIVVNVKSHIFLQPDSHAPWLRPLHLPPDLPPTVSCPLVSPFTLHLVPFSLSRLLLPPPSPTPLISLLTSPIHHTSPFCLPLYLPRYTVPCVCSLPSVPLLVFYSHCLA